MPKDPHRRVRVESELQRAVSELLRREIDDPDLSITITEVRVSPDLSHAKLFYAPFTSKLAPAELQEGLEEAARFLRGPVGRMLKLRIAPELIFKRDEQIAEGERLSALIDSALSSDRQRGGGHDDPQT